LLLQTADAVYQAVLPLAHSYESEPSPSVRAAAEVDALAEHVALEHLLACDDIRVYSEGCGAVGNGNIAVVVDPIDGTDNFVRGIPIAGPSLWAMSDDGTCASVVVNAFTGHQFWAVTGLGAYRDGRRLLLNENSTLPDELIVGGETFPQRMIYGRNLGASAHTICAVAEGRLAAYSTPRECPDRSWDVLGGLLIATEAGCHLATKDSTPPPWADLAASCSLLIAPPPFFEYLLDEWTEVRRFPTVPPTQPAPSRLIQ
jgi:myo-inositol-1(or 4)-monophosphatase